jgi:DNA transformation protein
LNRGSAFIDYVIELLGTMGSVTSRRMFGGHGIYQDGLMFALVTGDVLYFKTDDETRARFVAAGAQPFSYENKRRGLVETSYWQAPDDAMESPALMHPWARLGVEAALRRDNATVKSRRPAAKAAAAKKPTKEPAKRKTAATATSVRKPVKPRS